MANGKIQVELTSDQLAIAIRALESYGALLQNRVASEAALPLHMRLPPEIAAMLERQVDGCRTVAKQFEECRLDARLDAAFAGSVATALPAAGSSPKDPKPPRRKAAASK